MRKSNKKTFNQGFSLLEVIIAVAIFVTYAAAAMVAVISAFNLNRLGAEQTIANQYNAEGMEAVRSIKNQNFATLAAKAGQGNQGVVVSGGVWTFSGASSDTLASDTRFIRTIVVTSVQRDATGNIVASGGTVDGNTYKVVVTTTWNFTPTKVDSAQLTEYFTKWKQKLGGMLAYGSGGAATDLIYYQIFDGSANTWGTPTLTADVDAATTNKALRAMHLYSSSTRNEKILLSRHYDGSKQYIYAQVWNGTTWGNVTLLASWTASTFLDVLNFDGAYLANGNFMVVYSDGTTVIPKYNTWNGTAWGTAGSLTTLGASQIPNVIVTEARPGTNEVMAAFFTQGASSTTGHVITEYWSGSAWSAAINTHSLGAPTNTKRFVDFAWSPNTTTTGALVYPGTATATSITTKLFFANGAGGGSWSPAATAAAQASTLGAVDVQARPGANEFHTCDKDAGTPTIVCRKITFSGNTATFATPTSPIVGAASDTGIERSFDFGFKSIAGDFALMVYSNNTTTPQYKKYTASTTTWDTNPTPIPLSHALGTITNVRMIQSNAGNDIMAIFGDSSSDVSTIFFDGTNNVLYSTPAGKAHVMHTVTGSPAAINEFWYDFAWDQF